MMISATTLIKATSGVATCRSITMARRGIETSANPKPETLWTKMAPNTMRTIRSSVMGHDANPEIAIRV